MHLAEIICERLLLDKDDYENDHQGNLMPSDAVALFAVFSSASNR